MNIELPNDSSSRQKDTCPNRRRLLIDVIFLVIGLLAIPLAVSYHSWSFFQQTGGVILLGVFLAMALFGAALLSIILRFSSLQHQLVFSQAARLGARGGALVVGVAGGTFVLIAFLRYKEYLSGNAISVHPYSLWLVVSLSLIPVVSFASLCAIFFSFLLRSRSKKEPALDQQHESTKGRSGRLYTVALVLASLCFLSPALLPWIPAKAPVLSESPPLEMPDMDNLSVEPSEDSKSPIEPAFSYLQPLGFDTSPPHHWEVLTRKVIDGVDARRFMLMSPNGQYLAYCSVEQPDTLIVFDLNRFAVHSSYDQMDSLEQVAWSPESDLLFCLTKQERPFTSVIRVEQKNRLSLPLHKEAFFPNVQPFWWDDFEVAFFPPGGAKLYLDLVDMRVRPIEESHRWLKQKKESPSKAESSPVLEFTESSRVQFEVAPRIVSYQAPGYQQSEWTVVNDMVLSGSDKKVSHIRYFSEIDIHEQDLIASTARSMKTVRFRDDQAEVIYFTLKESPTPILQAEIPEGIDLKTENEFQEQLKSFAVCAFVCSPRVNPLTGQVVGSNRERIKALVRFIGWDKGKASLWIAEQYGPIEGDEVVSDLHLWRNGIPTSVANPFPDRWWANVSYLALDSKNASPPVPKMDPLNRLGMAVSNSGGDAIPFDSLENPTIKLSPEITMRTPQAKNPNEFSTPKSPAPDNPPATTEDRIRNFVRQHYGKLSNKDFAGYFEDYTENIVYYGKHGTREEHLQPAVTSLGAAKSLEVTLSDEISVREFPTEKVTVYFVSYETTLKKEDSSGKWTTHHSKVGLSVFPLGDTFRIVNEGGPEVASFMP